MQRLSKLLSTTQNLSQVNGLWRHNPLPVRKKVESWYTSGPLADDESTYIAQGYWQEFFDENLRWLYNNHIVDIGPGHGHFIDYANSKGFSCVGVDLCSSDHDCIMSYSDFAKLSGDFVGRARLVLEHIYDPVEFLSFWRKRLKKLLIIVPNEFNPLQLELMEKYGYSPVKLPHLSYFQPESLTMVCQQAGWKVEQQSATFPMELWCRLGFNYVDNPSLGEQCHLLRLKFEKSFGVLAFQLYQHWYDNYGWGRELVFLCS